ncbi:hypothetical protein G7Z17_g357 [Cylindrodendrum hubeiense]|uniref:Uncharacterized protein n=1 Tax=Cylindrodendrum hubeiense TaxID=595255 RepID=A0A9P5HNI8_9HYPO|nr:hypothetical protein G7Z17_g357 [Cylindrodendrum hubeiense]
MAAPPARASDLVRDSRLRTSVSAGLTHHTYYTSSPDARCRRARTKETWRRGRGLGNGTFGRVWLETCEAGPKSSQLRAVKEIPKDRTLSSSIDYSRELEAMAKFSHDRYVHCFVRSFGWYESSDAVFIAMEYVHHGDLQKHMATAFSEVESKQVACQLAEGLFFMHDNGFAHRDLKPANILVMNPRPNWWVKISDFGISKRAEAGSALRTVVGSDGYLAPEIIGLFPLSEQRPGLRNRAEPSYTAAVDIWTLGEIIVRILTRRSAFPDRRDLFDYVVHESPFPRHIFEDQNVSDDCYAFLEKVMAPSPSRRLLAGEALAHPWLEKSRPSSPASSHESNRFVDSSAFLQSPTSADDPGVSNSGFFASAKWSTISNSEVEIQDGSSTKGLVLLPGGSFKAEGKTMASHETTVNPKSTAEVPSQAKDLVIGSSQGEAIGNESSATNNGEVNPPSINASRRISNIDSQQQNTSIGNRSSTGSSPAQNLEGGVANINEAGSPASRPGLFDKSWESDTSILSASSHCSPIPGISCNGITVKKVDVQKRINARTAQLLRQGDAHPSFISGFIDFKATTNASTHGRLEKVPPQWDTSRWFDETLVVQGFSPEVLAQGATMLDGMIADEKNIKLSIVDLTIYKRSMPFAQGAKRVASYALSSVSTNRHVVKSFKSEEKSLAYHAEYIQCQILCKAFALEFNALVPYAHFVDFITKVCLKGIGEAYLSFEPYLAGTFIKYNSNYGYVEKSSSQHGLNAAAQAFSHFTFERSRGQFLVCDLQGVGHMLTDPSIHTLDPQRFELVDTNLGAKDAAAML